MPRVEIEIEQQLIDELSEAFFWEEQRSALYLDELSEARSERESPSPFVVARVNGLKVMIRPGEHGVPHFHVAYQGEEASGLIHSDDSQINRSSSSSRHESRNCCERHTSRPPSA
jgi:hypothetical protein